MNVDQISSPLRSYSREHLSPSTEERTFVSRVYAEVCAVLGVNNCIMIGSFARFTAVTPIHDLDVLYVLGHWNGRPDPTDNLMHLERELRSRLKNPTHYQFKVVPQTHSITISFLENGKEVFAVDIVPAYVAGTNEFGLDTYVVPEIISRGHAARAVRYQELAKSHEQMTWIKSDPRGYIEVAKRENQRNEDFRKAIKIGKGWKSAVKRENVECKLKSFHLEQIITAEFIANPQISIFQALYKVFCDLPKHIARAQIRDRADNTRLIDQYIIDLSDKERRLIIAARDRFLIDLERFDELDGVENLLSGELHYRASATETYLFDNQIPVLLDDDEILKIEGFALVRDGFRSTVLDEEGLIQVDRKIRFSIAKTTGADIYKWKVKNDNSSPEPRGEITNHKTQNDPESTKYNGDHFVECYAIKDGVCVAKARQKVRLRRFA